MSYVSYLVALVVIYAVYRIVKVLRNQDGKKRIAQRARIISEITSTEKTYVAQLKALDAVYISAMAPPSLSPGITQKGLQGVAALMKESTLLSAPPPMTPAASSNSPSATPRSASPATHSSSLSPATAGATSSSRSTTPDKQQRAAKAPQLKPQQAERLFANVGQILEVHQELCQELEVGAGRFSIALPFINVQPQFALYKHYVSNHAEATAVHQKLLKSSGYRKFCDAAADDPRCFGLDLPSLLITPIQRIPRYKLLLSEVLKYTDPNDIAEYKLVERALELVGHAATQVNEAVREVEQQQILQALQEDDFDDKVDIVKPGRIFVRKAVLTRVCRSSDKPFTFFLFSDMLMYCSNAKTKLSFNKYTVHHKMSIDATFKVELVDMKKALPSFGWKILSPIKSFVVYARDQREYTEWTMDLQKCVQHFENTHYPPDSKEGQAWAAQQGKNKARPLWMADKDSLACSRCARQWSLLLRRHHCRRCGELVCNDCSKARLPIDDHEGPTTKQRNASLVFTDDDAINANTNRVRVCKRCETDLRGFVDVEPTTAPVSSAGGKPGSRQIAQGPSSQSADSGLARLKAEQASHAQQPGKSPTTLPRGFTMHLGTDVGIHKESAAATEKGSKANKVDAKKASKDGKDKDKDKKPSKLSDSKLSDSRGVNTDAKAGKDATKPGAKDVAKEVPKGGGISAILQTSPSPSTASAIDRTTSHLNFCPMCGSKNAGLRQACSSCGHLFPNGK